MNTDAKPGAKVVYAYPEFGNEYEQAEANANLELNKTYTVSRVAEGDWSSTVFLVEVPEIGFNVVMFEDASDSSVVESAAK
jgi:hypothetical protein